MIDNKTGNIHPMNFNLVKEMSGHIQAVRIKTIKTKAEGLEMIVKEVGKGEGTELRSKFWPRLL
jgi:hypothetical protein